MRLPAGPATFGVVLAGSLLLGAEGCRQAPPPEEPPPTVEIDKIRDNLYVLRGGGGNTAVFIGAAGVTLVDTKYDVAWPAMSEALKKITDKPVIRIINTHAHRDHNGGNVHFPATVDVVAHENANLTMRRLRPGQENVERERTIFERNGGRGLPTTTVKKDLTIGDGAERIELHYFGAAHTDGDLFVVFPALHVMHVGDIMSDQELPFIDEATGGSALHYGEVVSQAAALPNVDTVINGHRVSTSTPADLQVFAEFVTDFVAFARSAKNSGKNVEEVVAEWKTPAKFPGYGSPDPARVRRDAKAVWSELK